VGFDAHGLGFFAEAVRRLPVDPGEIHQWGALPVPVRFMVGITDLPIKIFEELKRRDVVILDESWVGPGTDAIAINFGRRYAAAAVLGRRTITLTERLEEIMDEDEEEYLDEAEGLGKLSVRLSFDLGRRSIPLADLMQLGPGHVFDLGRDVRKAVTIRANGNPIGEGEIVDVDGQIGVVVLRLEPTA
jgi:type III secretion protein Q